MSNRTLASFDSTISYDVSVADQVGLDVAPQFRLFRKKSEIEALTVVGAGSTVLALYCTGGAADGDLFGQMLVWGYVASEPSHPGKLQTQDGAWWELRNKYATPQIFGAAVNGVTDDHDAIIDAADFCGATGAELVFDAGDYASTALDFGADHADLVINFRGNAWLIDIGEGGTDSYFIRLTDCPRTTWNNPHIDCNRSAWDALRITGSGAGNLTQSGGTIINGGEIRDFLRYGTWFWPQADNWHVNDTFYERRWDGPTTEDPTAVPVATPSGVMPACIRNDTVGRMTAGKFGGIPGLGIYTTTQDEPISGDPSLGDSGRTTCIGTRFNACMMGYAWHDANGKFTRKQATTLIGCYFENDGLRNAVGNAGLYSDKEAISFYASNNGRIVIIGARKFANNYAQVVFKADTGGEISYSEGAALQGAQPEHATGTGTTLWLNADGTGKFYLDGLKLRDEDGLTYDGATGKQNAYFSRDEDGAGGGALGAFVSGQSMISTSGWSVIPMRPATTLTLMDGTTSGWTQSNLASFATGTDPAAWMQSGQGVVKLTGDGSTGVMRVYKDIVLNGMKGQWILARAKMKLTEGSSYPNAGAKVVISDPNRTSLDDVAIAFQGEASYGQEAFTDYDTAFWAEDMALIVKDVCTIRVSLHLKIGNTFQCDDILTVMSAELMALGGEH